MRQLPVRPHEMAGVAVGDALQIILMLWLRFPEIAGGRDFGHHLAGPQARGVDIGDGVFGDALLFLARVEDGGAIARASVIALTVDRARIVYLEEEFQQGAETDLR